MTPYLQQECDYSHTRSTADSDSMSVLLPTGERKLFCWSLVYLLFLGIIFSFIFIFDSFQESFKKENFESCYVIFLSLITTFKFLLKRIGRIIDQIRIDLNDFGPQNFKNTTIDTNFTNASTNTKTFNTITFPVSPKTRSANNLNYKPNQHQNHNQNHNQNEYQQDYSNNDYKRGINRSRCNCLSCCGPCCRCCKYRCFVYIVNGEFLQSHYSILNAIRKSNININNKNNRNNRNNHGGNTNAIRQGLHGESFAFETVQINFDISMEILSEIIMSSIYWFMYRYFVIYDNPTILQVVFIKTLHMLTEMVESSLKLTSIYYRTSFKITSFHMLIEKYIINDDSTFNQWKIRLSIDMCIRFLTAMLSATIAGLLIVIQGKKVFDFDESRFNRSIIYNSICCGVEIIYFAMLYIVCKRVIKLDITRAFMGMYRQHSIVLILCFVSITLIEPTMIKKLATIQYWKDIV